MRKKPINPPNLFDNISEDSTKKIFLGSSKINLSDQDIIASPHGFIDSNEELKEHIDNHFRKLTKKISGVGNRASNNRDSLSHSNEYGEEGLNVLKWKVFSLNTATGQAMFVSKYHQFSMDKPPYKCFLLLLKKRIEGKGEYEVTFKEFTKATGINKKEKIKQIIRNLRRNLGINSKVSPQDDVFQATGSGYKLIAPLVV